MDKMLYIAASGLKQIMRSQSVNTHNLANVSTPGFRADLQAFKDMQVYGSGHSSRNYSVMDRIGTDFTEGRIVHTGGDLDIAIKGKGFMAIQSSDGREAYTRSTSLQVSQNGMLLNSAGHQVIGNGGPISLPPSSKVEIGEDGTVSVVPIGQSSASLAVIDRIKLVNPEERALSKGDDGLLYLQDADTAPADALVKVASGYVESSNVNVIDAMVNMIELTRNFEMQSKMMKSAEENDSNSSKLLTVS
jgi:flagellar basal-body rod protein FlgF